MMNIKVFIITLMLLTGFLYPVQVLTAEISDVIPLTTDIGNEWDPSITQTANGSLWVVWTLKTGSWDIHYKISHDGGMTWSPNTRLTTDPGEDDSPSVTQTADNVTWVVWHSDRNGNKDIYYKTSPDGGINWSADTQLTTDLSDDNLPAITQTTDGKIWIVWTSDRDSNPDIYFKTSSDGGGTWSEATRLTTDPSVDYCPSIIQALDGKIWIAWDSYRTGKGVVYYKTSGDNGITWSADTQLTADIFGDYHPSLAQTSDGQIWIAWYSFHVDSSDIYYKSSLDNGVTWSEDTQFTKFKGDDIYPNIATLNDSNIAIVWCSDRYDNMNIWFGIPGDLEDVNPPPHVTCIWHSPGPYPDPDEIVNIYATVIDETGVTDVELVYSIDSVLQAYLPMYDDGTHGDMTPGDGTWSIQVGPLTTGTDVNYQVHVNDTDNNSYLAPSDYYLSFISQEPWTATADYLLVIDSCWSYYVQTYAPFFTDTLDSIGVAYDVWDTSLRGAPDFDELAQYQEGAIVWDIPHARYGYLTAYRIRYGDFYYPYDNEPAISSLEAYLDDGGKLLLSGYDVTNFISGNSFLSDYLHANYRGLPNLYRVLGVDGDPISDGLSMDLSNFGEEIDLISPAVTVFTYDPTATQPTSFISGNEDGDYSLPVDTLMGQDLLTNEREDLFSTSESEGIQVQTISSSGTAGLRVDTGTYKVVLLSFGFESINNEMDRAITMERIINWLTPTVKGMTYEANGVILGRVTITIEGGCSVNSSVNGTYQIIATTTGNHNVTASKVDFRDQTQVIEITEFTVPYALDFKGNNGLVPNAPDISYVLACINKWIVPPGDGTGLDISKVLSIINAWKFPI